MVLFTLPIIASTQACFSAERRLLKLVDSGRGDFPEFLVLLLLAMPSAMLRGAGVKLDFGPLSLSAVDVRSGRGRGRLVVVVVVVDVGVAVLLLWLLRRVLGVSVIGVTGVEEETDLLEDR